MHATSDVIVIENIILEMSKEGTGRFYPVLDKTLDKMFIIYVYFWGR